jgi:aspartate kinase
VTGARAIAVKRGVSIVHMLSNKMLGAHGFLARIFEVFSRHGVSVDLIATSEVSVSVTIDDDYKLPHLMVDLEDIADVQVMRNQTIIAIVGRKLMSQAAIVTRALTAIDGQAISMISYGLSGLNLSIVLNGVDPDDTVRTIHRALFEGE